MADVYSQAERSKLMAKVRSKGNKDTELRLVAIFKAHGITGWRRHRPVFGKPDFVFPAERIAVFVDGCFWHGCPKCYTRPKTNHAFWDKKRENNLAGNLNGIFRMHFATPLSGTMHGGKARICNPSA